MKNCIQTIKDWVNLITSKVTNIELTYGVNEHVNYHVIIIKPSSVYNNEEYMELEEKFSNEFYSLFPNENILITDDDSIMDVTSVIIHKDNKIIERQPIKTEYEFVCPNNLNITASECNYALAA